MRNNLAALIAVIPLMCGLVRANTNFLSAADFSFVPYFESLGVQYRDGGTIRDPFQILKNHGINCVRLRIFTSSAAQAAADPYDYANNLSYNLPLALRVKNAGLLFSLDFHYSDTWADPGHQATPSVWTNLSFANLVLQMRAYNSNTIAAFATEGAMPDFVQVGNEIENGMLWPLGKVSPNANGGTQWNQLGQLMTAAVQGIQDASTAAGQPMPKIVVHIGTGGNATTAVNYFNNLEGQAVPFDIIGLSYYPFFQNSLSDLSNCLTSTANAFGKPIIVAETAFPWTNTCPNAWLGDLFGYPPSVIGQVSFLVAEGQVIRSVPRGLMAGVFYWGGEYQAINGVNEGGYNTASFWDAGGNVLPSLDAFVSIASPLTTGPPLAETLGASITMATNATLYAQAYANGLPSAAFLEWGTTTNYSNFTPASSLVANYLAQNVTAAITNLSPAATYHIQEVVVNAGGTNFGDDLTLFTPPLPVPPANPYQEDFGSMAFNLDLGEATALPDVGWTQILVPGGYGGVYITANAEDANTGQSLPSSTAYFGSDNAGTGFFYTTNGAGSGTFGESAFNSIDPALYPNLTFSIETQQSYQGTNVSSWFAVQVGGSWYVSMTPMTAYVEGAVSADFSLASLAFNPLASSWNNLTIGSGSVTVGNPASANLSGPITGVGVVVNVGSDGGSWDYNNFLITTGAPQILSQPVSQSVAQGGNPSFSVGATGAPVLVYQWQLNNIDLPGATNAVLALANVQPYNAGIYQVLVSNLYGVITSSGATLAVTAGPGSYLYREDFHINAGAAQNETLAAVGWSQVIPSAGKSSAGIYTEANSVDVNTRLLLPPSAAYYYEDSPGTGIFYTTSGAGSGTNGDSAFTGIDPTQYSNLTFSVETQQSDGGPDVSSRFAVQVGGAWYVSITPMTAYVESNASTNFSLTSLVYNSLASGWNNLTIGGSSVTVGSAASANLSGPITGIGIVVTVAPNGSWDYENLLISATDPFITSQPTNQSTAVGGNALFTVGATGAPALSYQWQLNNTTLPAATNSSLALFNVQPADAGPYQVLLSNAYESVTSAVATLDVTGVPVSFLSGPGSLQLANGQFRLSLNGLTGQGPVEIDASTNLVQWMPIYTNPSGFGTVNIFDTNASNYPRRFYRAITPSRP